MTTMRMNGIAKTAAVAITAPANTPTPKPPPLPPEIHFNISSASYF